MQTMKNIGKSAFLFVMLKTLAKINKLKNWKWSSIYGIKEKKLKTLSMICTVQSRKIKILKPEFVSPIEQQIRNIFNT